MSNQEIAKELEMSVSTLNRYSQKLINQSFHEVRSQLAMLFPKQQAPYKIELLNNESVDTLKETLSSCRRSTSKSSTFADNTTIDNICQHFKRANNIFIFGYGASYVCATDLYQNYLELG